MKKNKNKIVIVLISVILVIGLLFLIGPHNKPYTGITYSARNERACLVFHKNGKYSMNNCDGEPTNYFFDDEHECTYKYLKWNYKGFRMGYKTYKIYLQRKNKNILFKV